MEQKAQFFHDLLITLHTLRWTGNSEKLVKVLDLIGSYSYAHTNSNLGDEEDKSERAFEALVEGYDKLYEK